MLVFQIITICPLNLPSQSAVQKISMSTSYSSKISGKCTRTDWYFASIWVIWLCYLLHQLVLKGCKQFFFRSSELFQGLEKTIQSLPSLLSLEVSPSRAADRGTSNFHQVKHYSWKIKISYLNNLFYFRVNMLNTKEFPDKAGRIFPPVIAIEYGEVTLKAKL